MAMLALAGCGDPEPSPAQRVTPAVPPPTVARSFELRAVDPPVGDDALALSPTCTGHDVIATWIEPVSEEVHRVQFATLAGSPPRWSDPTTIVESSRVLPNAVDMPTPARAADGAFYATLLMRGDSPHSSYVDLARSADGRVWRDLGPLHEDRSDTEHGHASLFADGPALRAVWLDGRDSAAGGPTALRTALIGSDGTLSSREVLDPRVCDCCQTAGTTVSTGAFVAYRDRNEMEVRDIAAVHREERGWSAPATVHDDGWTLRGCPVNGPQADARGRQVAVAWYTQGGPGPRVRVAFSSDGGGTFGEPVDVDAAAPAGRVDVVWVDSGSVLVAWLGEGQARDGIRVLLRRVSPDRRLGAVVDAASVGGERALGVARLARLGREMLLAWAEAGPPRRVRAALFDPTTVPAATGAAPSSPEPVRADTLSLGAPLPDVDLTSVDGVTLHLGGLRGTATVVSFFASWCEPCRDEFPLLSRLAAEHSDALRVVGVSIDEIPTSSVAAFAREHGLGYTVAHDPNGTAAGVFGVPPIPATFVFDARGDLIYAHQGGGAELLDGLPGAVASALESAPEGERRARHAHGFDP